MTTNREAACALSIGAKISDLERPLRTLFQNTCGAHRENLKKIDPYYQQRRSTSSLLVVWVSDSSFWQHKVYADIREGFPGEGRQTTMGLSKTVIFSTFAPYFSEALVVRPTLLYSRLIIQSLAAFTLTPKYVKGHFTLNSVLSCQAKFKICSFVYRKRHYIYSRHKQYIW